MKEAQKLCSYCNQFLPISDFVRTKITKSGYLAHCKACESKRVLEKYYYQAGVYTVKQRFNKLKYRADKFRTQNVLTFEDYLDVIKRDEATCQYCGKTNEQELEESKRVIGIDHIKPLRRLGSNSRDNIILACQSCNVTKNKKELLEYYAAGNNEKFTHDRLTNVIKTMAKENNRDIKTMWDLIYRRYTAEAKAPVKSESFFEPELLFKSEKEKGVKKKSA